MEKYNVDNLNNLSADVGKIIDNNPLLGAGEQLEEIKNNFIAIQSAINNKGLNKEEKRSLLGKIFGKFIGNDKDFQFKSFEGKIQSIFSHFDLVLEGINDSIVVYTEYSSGLEEELKKLGEYISQFNPEELNGKDKLTYDSYVVMKDNLQLSYDRIKVSLNSAIDIVDSMEIARPNFQIVLQSTMIEVGGQRSLDAGEQIMTTLNGTLEGLSGELTKSTIRTAQIAATVSTRPMLSSGKLQENMKLLGNALEDLDKQKQKLLSN